MTIFAACNQDQMVPQISFESQLCIGQVSARALSSNGCHSLPLVQVKEEAKQGSELDCLLTDIDKTIRNRPSASYLYGDSEMDFPISGSDVSLSPDDACIYEEKPIKCEVFEPLEICVAQPDLLDMSRDMWEPNEIAGKLGIPIDPNFWVVDDVEKWVSYILVRYNFNDAAKALFRVPGATLCMMTKEDFELTAPQVGEYLYQELAIYKQEVNFMEAAAPFSGATAQAAASPAPSDAGSSCSSEGEPQPMQCSSSKGCDQPLHPTKQNIHLWQFLRELLLQPQYSSCIKWLDRSKGIFKIEDSQRVARLWGCRKNRPAMNYDKLSRSIRQYYKKGIIKKTDNSKRLVYQFCPQYRV